MSTQPEVNLEALEAGYKVELRQVQTEIAYVYITPQNVESPPFDNAALAWEAAYVDLKTSAASAS